jgi:hypothetical protein
MVMRVIMTVVMAVMMLRIVRHQSLLAAIHHPVQPQVNRAAERNTSWCRFQRSRSPPSPAAATR